MVMWAGPLAAQIHVPTREVLADVVLQPTPEMQASQELQTSRELQTSHELIAESAADYVAVETAGHRRSDDSFATVDGASTVTPARDVSLTTSPSQESPACTSKDRRKSFSRYIDDASKHCGFSAPIWRKYVELH